MHVAELAATDRRTRSTCSGRFVGNDSSDLSAANSRGRSGCATWKTCSGAPEITEAMLTEIDELVVVVPDELGGRERHHDLVTVGDRHEPCRAVQRPAVVVAVAHLGDSRVHAHADPQRFDRIPVLARAARVARQWRRRPHRPAVANAAWMPSPVVLTT